MTRNERMHWWQRLFFAAPEPVRATAAMAPRRCPECGTPYDPSRRHYCAVCTVILPEWRYG